MEQSNLTDKHNSPGTGEKPSASLQTANNITLGDKATITKTGLFIKHDCSKQEWFNIMSSLKTAGMMYKSMVGDAVRYGEQAFGKNHVENSLHQLEFKFDIVQHGRKIATIPLERRDEYSTLEAAHFYVVGHHIQDDDDERDFWLKIAVKEKLSPDELKNSIHFGSVVRKSTNAKTSGKNSGGITTIQGIRFSIGQWRKQVGEEPRTWTKEIKKEFLDATSEIAILREEVAKTI